MRVSFAVILFSLFGLAGCKEPPPAPDVSPAVYGRGYEKLVILRPGYLIYVDGRGIPISGLDRCGDGLMQNCVVINKQQLKVKVVYALNGVQRQEWLDVVRENAERSHFMPYRGQVTDERYYRTSLKRQNGNVVAVVIP